MNRKNSLIKKTSLKILSLFLSGIFVSMTIMAYLDTYSWFSNRMITDMRVSAANASDIIRLFEIDENNPEEIRVQRAAGLDYSPTVYFDVGEEASEYLRHVNPFKLTDDDPHSLALELNVSLEQLIELLSGDAAEAYEGRISLIYLNEYIIWDREFEFTRDFLISTCLSNILSGGLNAPTKSASSSRSLNDDETDDILVRLTEYIASLKDWEDEVKPDKSRAAAAAAEDEDVFSVKRLELNEDQIAIINIIAPDLIKYAEELYDRYNELADMYRNDTSALNTTIAGLESRIAELQSLIDTLEEELQSAGDAGDSNPPPPPDQPPVGPTPEPEPEPQNTPEPTPEPEPQTTPEPTPEPEITPEPTPEPEPEITPVPTPEPEPEITPVPTPEPEPEITPEPTPEPEPEPTPEPTPEPDNTQIPVME